MFILSGIWHGANWTFLAWGAYNAFLFLPLLLLKKNRKYVNDVGEGRIFPTMKELAQILCTFFLVVLGWIIFRSPDLHTTFYYFQKMLNFGFPVISRYYQFVISLILFMMVVEWFQRHKQHGLSIENFPRWLRWSIYLILSIVCLAFFKLKAEFIYFQF